MMSIQGHLLILLFLGSVTFTYGKGKRAFTAQVVEDIVQNEIAKKMPAAASSNQHGRKKSLTGVHLKEATDAINKLVDESIVDRVQEAEKEVSQMLLKSIEHHIQDAGKVLLKQDENTCRDKLDSCDKLAEVNVCETSKDAMVINCPQSCNFCGMLEELKTQAKAEDVLKEAPKARKTKQKKKKKHRKLRRKHKAKHHTTSIKNSNLAPEEVRLIHENLLDQTIDHANLPQAVGNTVDSAGYETSPVEHENSASREYEEDQKESLAEEEKEKIQEEQAEEESRQREEERKRKKAMHKQKAQSHAAVIPEESKSGKLIPQNPAGQDQPTSVTEAKFQPLQQVFQADNMFNKPAPDTTSLQYPISKFATANGAKRHDFTETDIINRNKQEESDVVKVHKKAAQKTLINKLMKVDLKNSKKKADLKLKHEIETMVDKAFGELLL